MNIINFISVHPSKHIKGIAWSFSLRRFQRLQELLSWSTAKFILTLARKTDSLLVGASIFISTGISACHGLSDGDGVRHALSKYHFATSLYKSLVDRLSSQGHIGYTVPASGKLTHSAGRLAAGLRLNAGSTAGRKLLLLLEFSTFVLRYCL